MKYLWPILACLLLFGPAMADPVEPMETLIPRFDKLASDWFQESGVPGMAIAVVYRDQVVYAKGFGVREAGSAQTVDADTVFQLASCSKPITSTALAILAGQGKLAWDDKPHHLLPELGLGEAWVTENVTYADLMSHRSGLPGGAGDILENLGLERDEILARLLYLKPGYSFRAGYDYSNYGYTAAGEAAARAVGQPFEEMIERTLFQPAGMTSTSARYEDYLKAPNRASTHIIQDGKAYPTVRDPQPQAPAGGVSSSANDMARWLRLHLSHGVLDGKTVAPEAQLAQTYQVHSLASNNPATFSGSGFYGLGWGVSYDTKGRLHLSHSGAFMMGARTIVTMLPQDDVGIVVLTNAYPSGTPEALSAVFFQIYNGESTGLDMARTINGKVVTMMQQMFAGYQVPHPGKPMAARHPLSAYAGTFSHDYFGDAAISLSGSGLRLKLGRKSFPVQPLNGEVFLVVVPERTYEDLVSFEIQFVTDGTGKVVGFRQNGLADAAPWFAKR